MDIATALAEALREAAKVPPGERWQALIDRGAIDADGNVLIRCPSSGGLYHQAGVKPSGIIERHPRLPEF